MINEQELQEAVNKLWEDDCTLLVKPWEVTQALREDDYFLGELLCLCETQEDVKGYVVQSYKTTARHLLIEAYEQEQVDKRLRDQEYSQKEM